MIISGLSPTGDFTFGLGQGNYFTENEAIGQNIATRILSWFGDCFFDTNAGIDWYNRLNAGQQGPLLELDLRRVILQSYGVTAINSFNYTLIDRKFSASYSVDTIFSKAYTNTLNQDL